MHFAWHYTTGEKFAQICESGFLLPAHVGVSPPEKPILWFSTAPHWEETACKFIVGENGAPIRQTMLDTRRLGMGLVRFGCPVSDLMTGAALLKAARMKPATWASLCAAGKRQGSDPADWWGRTKPLAIAKLAVDVMTDDLQWECVRSAA
jgi:hypothetical protein